MSRAALPHLLRSKSPHILVLSPPPNLDPRWFANHPAYTLSKYGMSLAAFGLSAELAGKVSVNTLWPRTTIATAAVAMLGGDALMRASRTPEIMADAAFWILSQGVDCNGNHFVDDEVMARAGVTDLSRYAVDPAVAPTPDLFVDPV